MDLTLNCAHCRKPFSVCIGHANRSLMRGSPLFCSRECFQKSRRLNLTAEQRKAEKAAYDRARRIEHSDRLRAEKRAHYYANHERFLRDGARRRAAPGYREKHLRYLHTPEYRAYKAEYDRRYRAQEYGEYAEAFLLLQDVNAEIAAQASKYEIGLLNGTINKAQTRRRALR